jgi:5'-nucleotidase
MKLRVLVVMGVAAALLAAGCSDDKTASSTTTAASKATTTTTTTTAVTGADLHILVTNDDGVGAPGIDALVQGLRGLQGVDVTVVAPDTNESGTDGKTTSGPLTVTDATTASGYPAKGVAGYSADTVIWAVKDGNVTPRPDLVMAGINNGQNVGKVVKASGTFGAAKEAASLGVPAVAVSQGLGDPPDFPAGVRSALEWLASHRSQLPKVTPGRPTTMWNLNVPTCAGTGTVRGTIEVPNADPSRPVVQPSNCASTETAPKDDVAALADGFAPLTEFPPT